MHALAAAPQKPRARDVFTKTIDVLSLYSTRSVKLAVAFFVVVTATILFAQVAGSQRTGQAATIVAAAVAVTGSLLALVISLAMCRKFVAASYGLDLDHSTLLTTTVKRVPHILGANLVFAAFLGLFFGALGALIFFVHLGFLALLPFFFIALFALTSYVAVGTSLVIAGPKKGLLASIKVETKGRWWLIFRMVFMVNLVLYIVALATSPLALLANVTGEVGALVIGGLIATFQLVTNAAGFAAIHHHLRLPTSAELLPEGFDPSIMSAPDSNTDPRPPPPPPPTQPNTPPPPGPNTPW